MGNNLKNHICQCGETEIKNFYIGRKNKCKKCILEESKIKYDSLSEEDKLIKLQKQNNWASSNIIKIRVLAAKHRAKRKKLEFDIDEDYVRGLLIKQNYKCKYSEMVLDLGKIGSDEMLINTNTLSIDRINSNLGYVKDNVVLVTAIVNSMKNELSEENFLFLIKQIANYNNL
jgi:hypothetical protein